MLPGSLELEHQPAAQRMELIIRHSILWQLHVLLVEQEECSVQLIACRVIDPARALAIGNAVLRIGCRTQSLRLRHEVRLCGWISRQKFIECLMGEDSAETLRKRLLSVARCGRLREE